MGFQAPNLAFSLASSSEAEKSPTAASWWLYSIDYDYIKNIGGTAQCFHPKARSGSPDIGAYAH